MKITTLVKKLPSCRILGSGDVEVAGLFYDSRKVVPGGCFFALRGEAVDGHRYIAEAIDRGARGIFMEKEQVLPVGVTGVVVKNTRRAMALAASTFFEDPTTGVPVVGVTGTNGKTTVSYLVESILRAAGRKPAVFGTVNYRFGERHLPSLHTTPESVDLLQTISEFKREGADSFVLEVSSHALSQYRVEGILFDVGVFTNLTPEHLDYHGEMESYFASKSKLFSHLATSVDGKSVVNIDDPYGKRLASQFPNVLTCGTSDEADIFPREFKISLEGIEGQVATPKGDFALRSGMLGIFNLQNLLCAAGAGISLGISPAKVGEGLASALQVPGRMERIENDLGAQIVVDYAHTSDALEKALTTLRELSPRRIITVFGCGGDRDRSKRPAMGKIGARLSDLIILTSDNPRSEDPCAILSEIREGVRSEGTPEFSQETLSAQEKGFVMLSDRREAIKLAAKILRGGDLLLVAGKGHEDYQIVGDKRFHFDDREELRRALTFRKANI